jgi:hypothetical protein
MVAGQLPALWAELRLVQIGVRWHEDPEFDWGAAVGELRRIEAEALRAADQAGGRPGTTPAVEDQGGEYPWGGDDPEAPLSPAKIADRLGIPPDDSQREALRKRLESWRKANLDGGWIETRDPKPREPRYLYPIGKVWPIVKDMKRSG